ncbi:hypothetical protein PCANC_22731 [Puccinia coronata f. sp. avenae]|uniref:Uncharacterized protein n=1 Tax=Puccinia coronata f. sp. avenae TaxID=200324 RepID=A0A2N5U9P7_9BASI|nr:hypothetical protein PCANC_22731 [Puccinia coronata f. sp. avenae]
MRTPTPELPLLDVKLAPRFDRRLSASIHAPIPADSSQAPPTPDIVLIDLPPLPPSPQPKSPSVPTGPSGNAKSPNTSWVMYSRVWTQSEAAVAEAPIIKIAQDHPEAPGLSLFAHLKAVFSPPSDQTINQTVKVTQVQETESQINKKNGRNESNSKRKSKTKTKSELELESESKNARNIITESEEGEEDSNSKSKKCNINQVSDGSDDEKMEEVGEEELKHTTANGCKDYPTGKVPLVVKLRGKKLGNGGEKETKKQASVCVGTRRSSRRLGGL